jgi:ssDNA-binding Zn-finger/Zn-ribbon topoisomerase 1
MADDLICVRRTGTVEEAHILAAWLNEQEIEAVVMDRSNPGAMAFGLTDPEGFAICVRGEPAAAKARSILEKHEQKGSTGKDQPVAVTCPECKTRSTFPGTARGRVQSCPSCGSYLDVPL